MVEAHEMDRRHLIDNARFDVHYDEKTVPTGAREQIERFIHTELIEVVDEVFNSVAGNERVYRIDRLELDLGDIPYADYRSVMPNRLRRRLTSALDVISYEQTEQKPGDRLMDRQAAARDTLWYFLQEGHLPWYAHVVDDEAFTIIFDQALRQAPAEVLQFLSDQARRSVMLRRIVHQFPMRSVQRLVELLAAAHTDWSLQDADKLRRMVGQKSAVQSKTGDRELEQIHRQWLTAFADGDLNAIEALWPGLCQQEPDWLVHSLRDYGQRTELRKRIAGEFSQGMKEQLLRLLEPLEHPFILAMIAQAQRLQPNKPQQPRREQQTMLVWEFTLAYLLVDQGSRFNRKSYLGGLIRSMAAANNLDHQEVLASLTANLEQLPWDNRLAADIGRLLGELADDIKPAHDSTPTAELYAAYERLQEGLFGRTFMTQQEDARLTEDLQSLFSSAPWLLMRLLRELQERPGQGAKIAPTLSAGLLEQLSRVLLAVSTGAQSGQPSELMLAVAAHMHKAADRYAFNRYLFDRLLNNQWIDFDAKVPSTVSRAKTLERQAIDKKGRKPHTAPDSVQQAEQWINTALTDESQLSLTEQRNLIAAIDYLTTHDTERLRRLLEQATQRLRCIGRLVEFLPDRLLVKLLVLLGLNDSGSLLQCAELLNNALVCIPSTLSSVTRRRHTWRFIYHWLARRGYWFNECDFSREYIQFLIEQAGQASQQEVRALLAEALEENRLPSTANMTNRLLDALRQPSAVEEEAARSGQDGSDEGDDEEISEDIYISNAGLVLLAPFFPRLFEQLGLMEPPRFKLLEDAERAVHMSQFLVNAQTVSPEYQLVLNKLLCGVRTGRPIRRSIEIDDDEKHLLEDLLHAVTKYWKPLANTSIDGLRESFLQRGGRLQLKQDAWALKVEDKSYDMLLEQIPWSYSTIKFSWMERPIYVEWR